MVDSVDTLRVRFVCDLLRRLDLATGPAVRRASVRVFGSPVWGRRRGCFGGRLGARDLLGFPHAADRLAGLASVCGGRVGHRGRGFGMGPGGRAAVAPCRVGFLRGGRPLHRWRRDSEPVVSDAC